MGYVLQVFHGPVIFLAKLAILLLLIRIFSIKRRFVLAVKVLVSFLALYYIAITLVKVFICKPVEKFWIPATPGSCLHTKAIFIFDCVMSLITDCVILFSPLPAIWGLQMGFKRKLGTSVALAIGAV